MDSTSLSAALFLLALFVEGELCPLTSSERTFDTPPLKSGRTYYYTMRVEMVRNGATVVQQQDIALLAGQRRGV